ncbi:MAG TPA: hypothetical protein VFJ16_22900 [Longimicrobium sp.]|nr:hypothetical protein [Longimicrobium sp.]
MSPDRQFTAGSYMVKARHAPGASSGTATFVDRSGREVGRSALTIRSWREAAEQFPPLYPDSNPQEIPRVTSGHWTFSLKYGQKWVVDCAGWIPYRVIWYGEPD